MLQFPQVSAGSGFHHSSAGSTGSASPARSVGSSHSAASAVSPGDSDHAPLLPHVDAQPGTTGSHAANRRAGDRGTIARLLGKARRQKDPVELVRAASSQVRQPTKGNRVSAYLNPHNMTDDARLPAIRELKNALERLDLGDAGHCGLLEQTMIEHSAAWHTLTPAAREKLLAVIWRYLAPASLGSYVRAINMPKNVKVPLGTGSAAVSDACGLATLRNMLGRKSPGDVASAIRINDVLALANAFCAERPNLDDESRLELLTLMVLRANEVRTPLQNVIRHDSRSGNVLSTVYGLADGVLAATSDTDPELAQARRALAGARSALSRPGAAESVTGGPGQVRQDRAPAIRPGAAVS